MRQRGYPEQREAPKDARIAAFPRILVTYSCRQIRGDPPDGPPRALWRKQLCCDQRKQSRSMVDISNEGRRLPLFQRIVRNPCECVWPI